MAQFPEVHGIEYVDVKKGASSLGDSHIYSIGPHLLGWDELASAKADPYSDTAIKLAKEFDQDGYVCYI